MNTIADRFSTLVDLSISRASETASGKLAYCFLADGEKEERCIEFGELHERACAVACYLADRKLKGARVLLLFAPGIEYICAFLGCLYAGAVAVPAFPPTGKRILPRLKSIVRDCDAALALCDADSKERGARFFAEDERLARLETVALAEIVSERMSSSREPEDLPDRNDLAFLQYTSGSTSEPKGVMVTHGNLLENERMIAEAFEHGPDTRVVGWLPPYHDMGLIGNILQPLYLGVPYYFMPPAKAMQDPYRWLSAITRYRATTSGAPNFAYDLCARKISQEQKASLDLSSWKVAYNGSEPVQASSLDAFTEAFRCCGFDPAAWLPCYGLAEATLLVSGARGAGGRAKRRVCDAAALERDRIEDAREAGRNATLVGCGRVSPQQELRIVAADGAPARGDGGIGEIWIKGPNVAAGYWGNEALTEETFCNWLGEDGPYCRTGDLGFLEGGQLFVTGRLKDLIIVNGRNLYPQDIERIAQSAHAKASRDCGAAFAYTDSNGRAAIALAQEVSFPFKQANFEEMAVAARKALLLGLDLRLDAIVWVKPGGVPKTSSGKVQRARCRELFLAGELAELARSAPGETACGSAAETQSDDPLAQWALESLRAVADRPAMPIALESSLASLGLDSIQIIELAHKIETERGVAVTAESMFALDTVADLVELLRASGRSIERRGNPVSIDTLSERDLDELDEKQVDALLKSLA